MRWVFLYSFVSMITKKTAIHLLLQYLYCNFVLFKRDFLKNYGFLQNWKVSFLLIFLLGKNHTSKKLLLIYSENNNRIISSFLHRLTVFSAGCMEKKFTCKHISHLRRIKPIIDRLCLFVCF